MEGCTHCHNNTLVIANNEFDIFIFIFIVKCF
jgi:hypothetical protein